jgi:hypothetical protein
LEFDNLGNLSPYAVIETDWKTFEAKFVHCFPQSITRKDLFMEFSDYLILLKSILGNGLFQWVNGSFVTNKLNPNDIDLVTFVDWEIYKANEQTIDQLREFRNNKDTRIDGYFVAVYPESHKMNVLYQADKLQWLYQFSRSRTDRRKGFIQLNH